MIVAIATMLGLGAVAAVTLSARYQGWSLGEEFLLQYQQNKLAGNKGLDTVFVGDSALGNAIDAAKWSRLSGDKTMNLALTASYGNGAFYNMLKQAAAHNPIRRAIVFEAITTSLVDRPTVQEGYLETLPRDHASWIDALWASARNVPILIDGNVAKASIKWRLQGAPPVRDHLRDDYIEQGSRAPLAAALQRARDYPLKAAQAAVADDQYLRLIAEFCNSARIDCRFAFAPETEIYCRNSPDFILAMTTRIEKAGLKVVKGTPLCLPNEELGNAENHVRDGLKPKYTELYFRLIH